jgi:hypothetical protein
MAQVHLKFSAGRGSIFSVFMEILNLVYSWTVVLKEK